MQTSGRAARNVSGCVIMYADKMTRSIQACIRETERRRKVQARYNEEHGITPESIRKSIHNILASVYEADYPAVPAVAEKGEAYVSDKELPEVIRDLKAEMKQAAKDLEFEKAAELRDRIKELSALALEVGI
jgi:excinuclease ABC subunit B